VCWKTTDWRDYNFSVSDANQELKLFINFEKIIKKEMNTINALLRALLFATETTNVIKIYTFKGEKFWWVLDSMVFKV